MNANYRAGLQGSNDELSLDGLEVRGRFPTWLSGTLIRNGPGAFVVGSQPLRHWFDGPAMLHKFAFHEGRVDYASKYLACDALSTSQAAGKLTYCEFATDPCRSLFKRMMTLFSRRPTDSAKVSLTQFAEHYLALAETPMQIEFDPQTLNSAGVFIHEKNEIGQMTTAHPHITDEGMYNVVIRYNRVSQYRLYRTSAQLQTQQIASVSTAQPTYLHSFGLSPRYAIITEFPFTVNPINLLLWLRPYIENFHWHARQPAKFWVIDRGTGEVLGRYESDPFFAFHHVNAFEEKGELFVDLVGYSDASIVSEFYLNRLTNPDVRLPHGHLRRYRLTTGKKQLRYETLSTECIEMPRFNDEQYTMHGDYRYVYGIGLQSEQRAGFYNQIVKIDARTGDARTWYADDCYPGEPVFVAAPTRAGEDDGVVLSIVLDAKTQQSFMLCLDARTFDEIGRAVLPQSLLFGFHGAYFPQ